MTASQQESPFEAHATEYDEWFDSERGSQIFNAELECLRQAVHVDTDRWLEVGVGSGRFASALRVRFGVDLSPAMVRKAAERNVDAYVASGENLPFENAAFDGVLMVCTICFLNEPEVVLRECLRVLKSSAVFVIAFIPSDSRWGAYYATLSKRGHAFYSLAQFYTTREVKMLSENTGFEFRGERSCMLPDPNELIPRDDIQMRESFAVLSFSKK